METSKDLLELNSYRIELSKDSEASNQLKLYPMKHSFEPNNQELNPSMYKVSDDLQEDGIQNEHRRN